MWAYCQLKALKKIKSTGEANIDIALHALPVTLHDTYERMLARALETDPDEALCLLRWLTFASRPLTLGELHETRRLVHFGRKDDVAWRKPGSIEEITDILGDLIQVSPVYGRHHDASVSTTKLPVEAARNKAAQSHRSGWRVQLTHSSVKDYITSDRISHSSTKDLPFQRSAAQLFLAQNCLAYFKRYTQDPGKTSTQLDFEKFPLLHYAAVCWSEHMVDDIPDRNPRHLSLLQGRLFRSDDPPVNRQKSLDSISGARESSRNRSGSALYHASRLGCASSVRILLEYGADVNAHGGVDCIAMAAALRDRCQNIFWILLEAGACLEPACAAWKALKWAAYHGFLDETCVLMQQYHSDSSRLRDFPRALDIAAAHGHLDVVKKLIAAGTSVTSTTREDSVECCNGYPDVSPMQGTKAKSRLALDAAVIGSHSKIVEALIEAGAGVTNETVALAASKSDPATIRILLKTGIDINTHKDFSRSTALYTAADSGRYSAVRALIEGGADIHAEGGLSSTPLRAACYGGYHDIVELLLDHGVDPNAGSDGSCKGTALEAASTGGYERIVRKLIAANAHVDAPGIFGTTALQTALHHGNGSVARILIDAGADTDAAGDMLGAAIHGGLADYVKQFLDAGADINTKVLGIPPLHFAASRGYVEIVRLLLSMSADVNFLDQHHGSALHAACSGRHASTVELLISNGADVNAAVQRRTALQVALSLKHDSIAKLLLAAGAAQVPVSAPVLRREQLRVARRAVPRPVQPRAVD